MNPGPAEEAGKAVTSFFDTMKSQPLSLALVVMNLALLGLLWWVANKQAEIRTHDIEIMALQQKEVLELISRCVVPPKT